MKSRIAVFEGYGIPRSFGRPAPFGRRGYYVPPERGYGPLPESGRAYPIVRRGYKVKRMKDTPAMKRAQSRMKKAAKKCSRARKGSFQKCMKRELKSKR